MRNPLPAAMLASLVLCSLTVHAAPPKVTHFYPLGAQRGKKSTITANGSFSKWPVAAWVNRPGLTVVAGKKKGKLEVTADDNAHGIYLVRLYDSEGAASVRPFVVDGATESVEKEPNDGLNKSQHVGAAGIVTGKLNKAGDVDCFSVDAKAGQTVVAALVANRLFGSPMDAVVQICDSRGFVLEQNDDSGGIDPLATHLVAKDGRYHVRVFAFPETPNSSIRFSGADSYLYRVTITSGPYLDYVLPLGGADRPLPARRYGWNIPSQDRAFQLPARDLFARAVPPGVGVRWAPRLPTASAVARNDSSHRKAQKVSLPITISGRIESPRDNDVFEFAAKKGQNVRFRVESRALGFPLDALLQIRSADDKLLKEADDSSRRRDPQIVFRIPSDGQYRVEIRDVNRAGGERYAYRLSGGVVTPDFSLTVAADQFAFKANKSVEIPVTVNRADGFSEDIELRVLDLPKGLTCKAMFSKGKKSAAVKLKITGKTLGAGGIRIVGKAKGAADRFATYSLPKSQLRLERLWITCAK